MSSDQAPITVHRIDDIIGLIPYLIGYRPADSLVLVAMAQDHDEIAFTFHVPLPASSVPVEALLAASVRQVRTMVHRWPAAATGIVLVGYGCASRVEPAAALASTLLDDAGLALRDAVRVRDGRYWPLPGDTHAGGILVNADTNPAVAAAIAAGLIAYDSPQALAATLDPVTGHARHRMTAAVATACAWLTDTLDTARGMPGQDCDDPDAILEVIGQDLLETAFQCLVDMETGYQSGCPAGDDAAARLIIMLELPDVWVMAARRATGAPWQIQMWSDLVRRSEPPFTAAVALLLAATVMRHGHHALARIALQRAIITDPTNDLAADLIRALATGLTPAEIAAVITG